MFALCPFAWPQTFSSGLSFANVDARLKTARTAAARRQRAEREGQRAGRAGTLRERKEDRGEEASVSVRQKERKKTGKYLGRS